MLTSGSGQVRQRIIRAEKYRRSGERMDTVDSATRSRMMAAVRSKNTVAEVELRRCLFHLGYRYRLHVRGLPGTPDIVFPKYRAIVFLNGCFWHNHDCRFGALPTTRRRWWRKKLEGNRKHDSAVIASLLAQQWRALVIWECSFRRTGNKRAASLNSIADRVSGFLRSRRRMAVISGPVPRTQIRPAGA